MVPVESQKMLCPVCRQSDKVKKLQAAYNEGLARFAPPLMPTNTIPMLKYMLIGMFIVGICVFLIIVFIGSDSFGMGIDPSEIVLVSVTLVGIVTALVLSYLAFKKVVRGDQEVEKYYAAWDQAVEQWGRFRYCSRDDVVFDPQTGKTFSEEALSALMSTGLKNAQAHSQTLVHN